MTNPAMTRIDRFFSCWLTGGLLLYLCGFFLAPSSKAQYLTLYIGTILPAFYFSIWHFKRYFIENDKTLLGILIVIITLYIPSLWAPTEVLDTLRKNLKHIIFVMSLAIAIRHFTLLHPSEVSRIITLLLLSSIIALGLFYFVLIQRGVMTEGNTGYGTLGDNPNETGLALSVGLILLAKSFMDRPKLAAALLAVPFLAAIYLANSRSAMLGLAIALPLLVLLERERLRLAMVYIIISAIAAAFLVFLMATDFLNAEQLLSKRPSLWGEFLSHYPDHSWLWGSGLSGSITVFSEIQQVKLEPHSLYFSLLLRGGLLALLAYLSLLLIVFRRNLVISKNNTIWLCLLIFGLVTQFFEGVYPLRSPNSFWLYTWLPIFILLIADNKAAERSNAHK